MSCSPFERSCERAARYVLRSSHGVRRRRRPGRGGRTVSGAWRDRGAWQKAATAKSNRDERRRAAVQVGAPADAHGRALAGVPRVLRAARGELHDGGGASRRARSMVSRRCWLNTPRRVAHALRGGVRRVPQDVALRGVRRVQGETGRRRPTSSKGAGRARSASCSIDDARALRRRRLRGGRRHRHARRAGRGRGLRGLIVTGDRDSFQLVTESVTGAVPDPKGVSELTRFTPEKVREKYDLTKPAPGLRGAARRPVGQPPGHPWRRREDGREVDQPVRFVRRAGRARRRGQGQGRANLQGSTWRPSSSTAGSPRSCATSRAAERASATWGGGRTTAPRSRWSWTPWRSGTRRCASACSPSTRARRRPSRRRPGPAWAGRKGPRHPARSPVADQARRSRPGCSRRSTPGRWASGTVSEIALAAAGGGRLVRPVDAGRRPTRGVRRLARRREEAEGPAQRQGVMRVLRRARLERRGHHHGHGARRVPGRARPRAQLRPRCAVPGYLGRELAPAGAADGQLAFGTDEDDRSRGRRAHGARPAPSSTWARRSASD